uniref:Transmembrane protein n=1 Tax=Mus rat paramyxovirus TaxID=3141895 RepID=A0AAU7E3K6_9MONO
MGAYLIIAIENLKYLKFAHTTAPECKMTENAEERLSQMSTAVNTMMNSLTYTLPTVLNTQKATLLARMNHLVTEIKEVARLNNVDLNVRMGTNKTVALKTGNHGHTIHPRALTTLAPYTTKRIETFTLVPKTPKKYPGFYPMVKVDDAASLENRVIAVTKIFGDKGLDEESRYQTVWNLNPSN